MWKNSPIRGLICRVGGGEGWQYARIATVNFHHLKASNVFFIYFIDECQMRYPQKEKEVKTRKNRKKEKVYLVSLVSMIHIRCHNNVRNIKLTALVGKRRSHHSYGLWCRSKKNNSCLQTWNTLFFEQPSRLLWGDFHWANLVNMCHNDSYQHKTLPFDFQLLH